MTIATPRSDRADRISLPVLIAAWAFPVLVLGQFAFVAGIPVAVVLISSLRAHRSRARRWWAAALTAAYAVPLAFWLIGPGSAPSLSKYLSPVATALVVAVGGAVVIAHHVLRTRKEEVPR